MAGLYTAVELDGAGVFCARDTGMHACILCMRSMHAYYACVLCMRSIACVLCIIVYRLSVRLSVTDAKLSLRSERPEPEPNSRFGPTLCPG